MKIIIECTQEERKEILKRDCYNYYPGLKYKQDCLSIIAGEKCDECFQVHGIEFKIVTVDEVIQLE